MSTLELIFWQQVYAAACGAYSSTTPGAVTERARRIADLAVYDLRERAVA